MNPRLAATAIVVVLAAGGIFLMTATRSKPVPGSTAVPVATPSTPAVTTPVPPSRAAAPDAPRATEPRRRTPAPAGPAASPAPAVTADSVPVETVTLHVDADVPDAQVFVDRTFIGKAPITTTDVKPGPHRLNVSAPGFDGVARDIEVKPGSQEITMRLREVRLDTSLDVVHKHRIGSCRGRLVATPAGMRYETTDKGDAFSAPLVDLETFEVDYLQKNLRIKPKAGKRYDFTDPDGNADRLFVFHRDVQKARERLQRGDAPVEGPQ
jgi:hypothetical protein